MRGSITTTNLSHIPQFGGNVFYVNTGSGDDNNSGKAPDLAFATIGAGITAAQSGDAISVKAGTYTEASLDLGTGGAKSAVELWAEIGTLIDTAGGATALTVSGASCKITGNLKITPDDGEIGLLVSGAECKIEGVKILEGSHCFSITGQGVVINDCAAGFPASGTAGFNINGIQARLNNCSTVGDTTTYGYLIKTGKNTGRLSNCTSVGHATSGFYIETACTDWTIFNCSSGSGDGKWRDIDSANVWCNFCYDDIKYKEITGNGALQTFDLFKITGSVKVTNITAHVESTDITCAGACTVKLELEANGAAQDISTAGGNINGLLQGSVIVKDADTGEDLSIGDNNGDCVVVENANYRDPNSPLILVKESGQDTHIQLVTGSTMDASSKLHWHVEWEPITDSGFLEPA